MPGESRIAGAVAECRQLVDRLVRTVRDLALGLRPSMLDDLGLQPALAWQVRDFSPRYGVPVELEVDGDFETVPEQYRTGAYRIIQEALTNCVRHARASRICVNVRGGDELTVSVADDGVGFDPAGRHDGFGLRGIEERVRELEGAMTIRSGPDAGHGPDDPPPGTQPDDGGGRCAYCWLTITASSAGAFGACSRPTRA